MRFTTHLIVLIVAVLVVVFQGFRIYSLERADVRFYNDTEARTAARDREIAILERRIERAEDKSGTR